MRESGRAWLDGSGPAVDLPTFTLAGAISGVAQVQVRVGATSSVMNLAVATYSVRGPGIVIWVGQTSGAVQDRPQADILFRRIQH